MAKSWIRKLLDRKGKPAHATEESSRSQERGDINQPPYLETPRPRDLEYPLEVPAMIGSVLQQTCEQTQSGFMSLPYEMRLAIYDVLFGNKNIHLFFGYWPGTWKGGRIEDHFYTFWNRKEMGELPDRWNFFHSICSTEHRYAPPAEHWHCVPSNTRPQRECSYVTRLGSHEPYHKDLTIGVIPMLLTCRRIYTEVLEILYSKNRFSIEAFGYPSFIWRQLWDKPFAFPMLPRLFVSHHFSLISNLDLEWNLAFSKPSKRETCFINPQEYDQCWEVLASMKGLKRLFLHLQLTELGPPAPVTKELCDILIKPISRMRGRQLKEFHIVVCEPYFRIFRYDKDAIYTMSFYKSFQDPAEPYDDSEREQERGRDDGSYFPKYILPPLVEEGTTVP